MLFDRAPEPGEEDIRLYVPEEQTTTPMNLFGIGLFAACGFLLMAGVSQPETRGAPLFVGGLILALLGLTAAFLMWQRRYGESTLKAKSPLTLGARFEGWIETELTALPAKPVRVAVEGREERWVTLHVSDEVAPVQMHGKVRVPFSLQIPDDENARRARVVQFTVRAHNWPVGWGATFVLGTPV